jgi:hypothetical protein
VRRSKAVAVNDARPGVVGLLASDDLGRNLVRMDPPIQTASFRSGDDLDLHGRWREADDLFSIRSGRCWNIVDPDRTMLA